MESDLKQIGSINFERAFGESTNYLTHNFHTYPAKFIPQIPKATMLALTKKGDVILDPFGGCGTTLVEAKLNGRNAIAVDINPIAYLVSKAKTTKLTEKEIQITKQLIIDIKKSLDDFYHYGKISQNIVIPKFSNIDHWFQKDMQNELAIIKSGIDKIENEKLKNYLYVAFSSILVKASNQESDTRFASINKSLTSYFAFNEFKNKLSSMNERILEFSAKASDFYSEVHLGDARDLDFLEDSSIDHIVTSPPYANTYDYYLYHKFRMLWLGYNFKDVQKDEIGSRDKHSSKKLGIEDFENSLSSCLIEMERVLKKDKYAVIVIGDSILQGELIRADRLIEKICSNTSFRIIKKISYNLSKNSKMFNPKFTNNKKMEHIIFLKNYK